MTDSPEQHDLAGELFLEARRFSGSERDAYLERACEGNEALCVEVKSLLRWDGAETEIEPTDGAERLVGQRIGRYEIRRLIAGGGMGVVYEAEQDSPRRRVALKVMRDRVASRDGQRRFRREGEVLGRLRHPGIAQVHEAGMHEVDGRRFAFFAMELVEGARTLVEYAEDEGLGLRSRVELFAQVCDAVHYGHQRAIIHRDLKPGNILVDGDGRVKVIDFGVARVTDSDIAVTTQHTEVGQLVGTVQYMSPEQCAADPDDLDIRSDVYSLGVVLYELLCGRAPYDVRGKSLPSAARAVCEAEVDRPSVAMPRVRGDLERVVLKAMERDRETRYGSAAALGDDLRRWLRGEVVSVRGASVWGTVSRWVERHPVLVTTGVCAAIALSTLASTFIAVWWVDRRPFGVEIASDKSKAWLVSYSGHRVWTYGAGATSIRWIEKVEMDDGRWIAVVSFSGNGDSEHAGRIVAFEPGRPDEPLWRQGGTGYPDFVAPHARVRSDGDVFFPSDGHCVADVFAESEGPEIIAAFGHRNFSPASIRVLSAASGAVLYEAWHDGHVEQVAWMAGPRLIVCIAWSNRLDPKVVGRGAWPAETPESYMVPQALFAIHPEYGARHGTWIGSPDSESVSRAEWYKVVGPPEVYAEFLLSEFSEPSGGDDRAHFLGVDLRGRGLVGSVNLTIDDAGRIVARYASGAYDVVGSTMKDRAELIDVERFDPNLIERDD